VSSLRLVLSISRQAIESEERLVVVEEPTPIFTRRLYLYREVPVAIVERSRITNTLRYTFRYVKNLGKRLSITLDFSSKEDSTLIKDGETFITLFSNPTTIMSKLIACYNENDVGPYGIRFANAKMLSRGNVFEVEVCGDDKDFCDWSLIMVPKALAYGGVRGEWIYKRLARGFYEDGLIWYLVKEGRVPRNLLPPYIADEQAYYWPRGDVLRESLYRWLQYGDLTAFHIYSEVINQIIRQMTPRGGLVIPFITAAMWRNIFGSPQQLYAFEALYRAYQLTGVESTNPYHIWVEDSIRHATEYSINTGSNKIILENPAPYIALKTIADLEEWIVILR